MSAPDFWDDQNAARALMAEVNPLKHRMEAFSALKSRLEDIDAAIELAQEADDDDLGREAVEEFARWQKSLADFELLTLLNGPQDQASCYVTIHAGAGGTEACDWASMLLRMYIRWCERRGFSVTYLESTDGDDAGIRSVTLKVDGEYAYGYLKNDAAYTGWCAFLPLIPPGRDILLSLPWTRRRKFLIPSILKSWTRI